MLEVAITIVPPPLEPFVYWTAIAGAVGLLLGALYHTLRWPLAGLIELPPAVVGSLLLLDVADRGLGEAIYAAIDRFEGADGVAGGLLAVVAGVADAPLRLLG